MRRKWLEPRVRRQSGNDRRSARALPDAPANPWLRAFPGSPGLQIERIEHRPEPEGSLERRLEPQPGLIALAAEARFPRVELAANAAARLWWLGAHGGAGETTLARLLPGSRAAGHAWPVAAGKEERPPVMLVARTHAAGLHAAQAAARDWASGDVPVRLLGLVLIADVPGRMPRALRDLAQLVAGGAPAVWRLPWHEPWRLGEAPEAHSAPGAVRALLRTVDELAPATATDIRPGGVGSEGPRAAQSPPQGVARA